MTAEQLGAVTDRTDIRPVIPTSQESEDGTQSRGVALLIVGMDPARNGDNESDPLIFTIIELQGKAETERSAGQVSIPADTRKVNEGKISNMLGALAECCDDSVIPELVDHLFLADSSRRQGGIVINGHDVDVSVLVYDGPLSLVFVPQDLGEVKSNGWIKRNEIRKMEGVRSVLSEAIGLDIREGLTRKAIEDYHSGLGMTKVFTPGFSMKDFFDKRETMPDVRTHPQSK